MKVNYILMLPTPKSICSKLVSLTRSPGIVGINPYLLEELRMEKPEILKGVDLNKLKEWLSDMNGHGVWKPEFFESMGFSRSFIKDCIRKHDWLILNNGKRGSAYGVGEVDFTEKLACCLQADTSQGDGKIGRGSRARGYATGCLKVLDKFQSGE